jgi:uncharacterized ubiquitin-like protein YukD
MGNNTHINITIDFTNWGGNVYDLRVPTHQQVKQLLVGLVQTLHLNPPNETAYAMKVVTKGMVISNDDRIVDFNVTDGDLLQVL